MAVHLISHVIGYMLGYPGIDIAFRHTYQIGKKRDCKGQYYVEYKRRYISLYESLVYYRTGYDGGQERKKGRGDYTDYHKYKLSGVRLQVREDPLNQLRRDLRLVCLLLLCHISFGKCAGASPTPSGMRHVSPPLPSPQKP